MDVGRFAPSSTGPAHPGTLLAALLCWLDARSRGAAVRLRLEDLDPERARPGWSRALGEDLAWLGLDWDGVDLQSEQGAAHAEALDRLEAMDRLYPCACSRSQVASTGVHAPDGGWRYPNTCRARPLPAGGWREARGALRVRLDDAEVRPRVEDGMDLAANPLRQFGDPLVRRRDGAVAYHLGSVVDDASCGVTRVVRGRDLAFHTATQVALERLLGFPEPVYRHHLLLLEPGEGEKLAKFHGAVGSAELRLVYSGPELCGFLAWAAGLLDAEQEVQPAQLVAHFSWDRVATADRVVDWNGECLRLAP